MYCTSITKVSELAAIAHNVFRRSMLARLCCSCMTMRVLFERIILI